MSVSPYLVDDIGPILGDLSRSVIDLQQVNPVRLAGDGVTIDSAVLALLIVRKRIHDLQAESGLQAAE
jgi:hypothetical protein